MKITSLLTFLFIFSSICLGDEIGIQILLNGPIPVGGTSNRPTVQRDNSQNSGKKLDFNHYLGSDNGFLFGLGYAVEENLYIYPKSVGQTFNYESKLKILYARAGYWFKTEEKIRVSGSLSLGYGTYEFKEKAAGTIHKDKVLNLDLEGRVSYDLEIGNSNFEVLVGGGIKKSFVPSFSIDRENINSSDFGPYPYLQVGIGFSF